MLRKPLPCPFPQARVATVLTLNALHFVCNFYERALHSVLSCVWPLFFTHRSIGESLRFVACSLPIVTVVAYFITTVCPCVPVQPTMHIGVVASLEQLQMVRP